MRKIIYEVLYNRFIYTDLERVLKTIKDTGISISRTKTIEFYCHSYTISKSTYIIFYTPLSPTTCPLAKIYVDTIEYKPPFEKGNKYIVYVLDRYSNYQ
jgi:hypothetical protein